MNLLEKYSNIVATGRKRKASPFLRAERGTIVLNNSDLILNLVEQLIAEKEKNFILQQKQQQQPISENNKVKTDK